MSTLFTSFQNFGHPASAVRQEKEIKGIHIGKKW
jgi:hypothetical protein